MKKQNYHGKKEILNAKILMFYERLTTISYFTCECKPRVLHCVCPCDFSVAHGDPDDCNR